MPFLKVALPPPPNARRRRTLGQFHKEPWLQTYENGFPMATVKTLSGYERAPWMQNYINGHPMEPLPDGGAMVPKAELVKMALRISVDKKCSGGCQRRRGMRGLGDGLDTSGDPSGISLDTNPADYGTAPAPVYDPNTGTTFDPNTGIAVGPSTASQGTPIVLPPGGGVFNPATGQITPAQSSLANSIASIASGIARAVGGGPTGYTSPYYAGTPSSIGAALSQPIYAGSSLTTGTLLLIVGGAAVVMLLTGKKRR